MEGEAGDTEIQTGGASECGWDRWGQNGGGGEKEGDAGMRVLSSDC